ncbi:MAG TPA: SprT family zinc-dependent metalloprotease [Rhizomicrobium sp.]|jgi:predicted metal-dependent hydrolase|nr:SprT family zinc-dependent metalloprotease [Rhizomicrobium sp.]
MRNVKSQEVKSQALSRALLRVDGRPVEVTMRLNPRARRLIVKVHPSTGEVTVVAPTKRAMAHALDFAQGQTDWIATKLAHVPVQVPLAPGSRIPFCGVMHTIVSRTNGPAPVWIEDGEEPRLCVAGRAEHASRRILDFLKKEARRILSERSTHFAEKLGLKPRRIVIRDTTSRWGSCSAQGVLSYSWRLILAPSDVLDYVVAHEVAHLVEMNHSARFWRQVSLLMPGYEGPQAWLAGNATQLHRYDVR